MEGRDRLETALASDHISAGCSRNFMYLSEEAIFKNSDRITRIRGLMDNDLKSSNLNSPQWSQFLRATGAKCIKGLPPSTQTLIERRGQFPPV